MRLKNKTAAFLTLGFGMALASSMTTPISSATAQEGPAWKTVCTDNTNAATCRISQDLSLLRKGADGVTRPAGRILSATIVYASNQQTNTRQPYLNLRLPMGVDLRAGAAMKIDEGQDVALRYLRCTNAGCEVSMALNDQTVNAMKAGNNMFVAFRPWGSQDSTTVNVTLKGFTRAFRSIQ